MQVPFVGQTYQHRSRDVSSERCLNLYPERVEGKSEVVLIGTPGTTTFTELTPTNVGGIRALHYTSSSQLFAVAAEGLYEVESDGAFTKRATLSNLVGRVAITDNGTHLVVADNSVVYTYPLAGGSLASASGAPSGATHLTYLGGYVFANEADSNKFYWSDLDDATTWDALSFATAESSADHIIAIGKAGKALWLFGPRSFEVWVESGVADLPVQPVGGSASEIGCGARYSVASIADTMFWLGSSNAGANVVFMSQGYSAQRISNHAIEYAIGQYVTTSDAIGFTYQQEGHVFYVLTFPSANATWVYDMTTGLWHERGTRNASTDTYTEWEPLFATYAFGLVIVGGAGNPFLYSLSLSKYTEWDGRPIVRIRQTRHYWDDMRRVFHRSLVVDMETGQGEQSGVGFDPQAMLQYSDDGGYTWSSELWRSMGKIGKYRTRCRWDRLGSSSERVYRLTISDPVPVVIVGASLDAVAGSRV